MRWEPFAILLAAAVAAAADWYPRDLSTRDPSFLPAAPSPYTYHPDRTSNQAPEWVPDRTGNPAAPAPSASFGSPTSGGNAAARVFENGPAQRTGSARAFHDTLAAPLMNGTGLAILNPAPAPTGGAPYAFGARVGPPPAENPFLTVEGAVDHEGNLDSLTVTFDYAMDGSNPQSAVYTGDGGRKVAGSCQEGLLLCAPHAGSGAMRCGFRLYSSDAAGRFGTGSSDAPSDRVSACSCFNSACIRNNGGNPNQVFLHLTALMRDLSVGLSEHYLRRFPELSLTSVLEEASTGKVSFYGRRAGPGTLPPSVVQESPVSATLYGDGAVTYAPYRDFATYAASGNYDSVLAASVMTDPRGIYRVARAADSRAQDERRCAIDYTVNYSWSQETVYYQSRSGSIRTDEKLGLRLSPPGAGHLHPFLELYNGGRGHLLGQNGCGPASGTFLMEFDAEPAQQGRLGYQLILHGATLRHDRGTFSISAGPADPLPRWSWTDPPAGTNDDKGPYAENDCQTTSWSLDNGAGGDLPFSRYAVDRVEVPPPSDGCAGLAADPACTLKEEVWDGKTTAFEQGTPTGFQVAAAAFRDITSSQIVDRDTGRFKVYHVQNPHAGYWRSERVYSCLTADPWKDAVGGIRSRLTDVSRGISTDYTTKLHYPAAQGSAELDLSRLAITPYDSEKRICQVRTAAGTEIRDCQVDPSGPALYACPHAAAETVAEGCCAGSRQCRVKVPTGATRVAGAGNQGEVLVDTKNPNSLAAEPYLVEVRECRAGSPPSCPFDAAREESVLEGCGCLERELDAIVSGIAAVGSINEDAICSQSAP